MRAKTVQGDSNENLQVYFYNFTSGNYMQPYCMAFPSTQTSYTYYGCELSSGISDIVNGSKVRVAFNDSLKNDTTQNIWLIDQIFVRSYYNSNSDIYSYSIGWLNGTNLVKEREFSLGDSNDTLDSFVLSGGNLSNSVSDGHVKAFFGVWESGSPPVISFRKNSLFFDRVRVEEISPQNYTINKAQTQTSLYLNGTNSNTIYNITQYANITAVLSKNKTICIDSNLTNWTLQCGTGNVSTEKYLDKIGIYNITAYFPGDQNYSSSKETWFIDVKDYEKPSITILSPTAKTYGTKIIDLKYVVNDNGEIDWCGYSLNGGSVVTLSNCSNITIIGVEGSNIVMLYVNDTAGNSASANVTFKVSTTVQPPQGGAGGGGTGGGGVSTVPSNISYSFTSTIAKAKIIIWSATREVELLLDKAKGLPITKSLFTSKADISNATITFKAIKKPLKLPSLNITYKYMEVSLENINDKAIQNSSIYFKVDKSWTIVHNIDVSTISLYKFNGTSDKWQRLPTKTMREDPDYLYYKADTRGFSIFAIAGQPKPEIKQCPPCPFPTAWSDCTDGKQTRTNYKCSEQTGYKCVPYAEEQKCGIQVFWPYIINRYFLGGLLIVVILTVSNKLIIRPRIEYKKEKKKLLAELKLLSKRKRDLVLLRKEAQLKYYKYLTISKGQYNELMKKYETEEGSIKERAMEIRHQLDTLEKEYEKKIKEERKKRKLIKRRKKKSSR